MILKNKAAARAAACVLALSLLLCGCGSTETDGTEEKDITAVEAAAADESEEAALPADNSDADKTETVYVTADACGNPEKTEVTVTLKAGEDGSAIKDVSDLTDIRNSGGDEELTQNGTSLEWQNLGEPVTYKGESDKSTPVTVKVSYFLDGSEITPEELAGKSGKVTIRLDYENTTAQTVEIDGTEYSTVIPYVAISAVLLPEDNFSNIEVKNGSVMSLEGQRAVIGFAVPGLADALKLDELEATEDVELPEYMEITADCVDFELDFTATILTNGLLEKLEDDDLDDISDLTDDLQELADAGDELTDAVLAASDGADTIADYLKQYVEGVDAFGEGVLQAGAGISALAEQQTSLAAVAAQLDSGLAALNSSIASIDLTGVSGASEAGAQLAADAAALQSAVTALESSIDALASFASDAQDYEDAVNAGVESADSSLAKIDLDSVDAETRALITAARSALAGIPDLDVPDVSLDVSAISSAIAALQADAAALGSAGEALAGVSSAVAALQQSLPALSQAAAGVDQGTSAIASYLTSAAEGLAGMDEAVASLKTAGSSLANGLGELTDGMKELYDGVKEFNDEGLQELGDFGGTDLQNLLGRIKALKAADADAPAFTGSVPGAVVETSYIIETAEIRAD